MLPPENSCAMIMTIDQKLNPCNSNILCTVSIPFDFLKIILCYTIRFMLGHNKSNINLHILHLTLMCQCENQQEEKRRKNLWELSQPQAIFGIMGEGQYSAGASFCETFLNALCFSEFCPSYHCWHGLWMHEKLGSLNPVYWVVLGLQ